MADRKSLSVTYMMLFGREPLESEFAALADCERWFQEIKQKRQTDTTNDGGRDMNIYELVADRLTKDERHTLWVEADENPNFVHNLIEELNRNVPLEAAVQAPEDPGMKPIRYEQFKKEDMVDAELDGSEIVANFADVLPGTVYYMDEAGLHLVHKEAREEHDDQRTVNDRRPIHERMRDGGMTLKDLIDAMFHDGAALATTLNGLYFLDLGSAQPVMDEENAVWDGAFEWDADRLVMKYVGQEGPSGFGSLKTMILTPDTLIELF